MIQSSEDKIPGITNLATTTALNANEVKGKMPSITNLATNTALTAVKIKIPVTNLKTDYNTKISETENKIKEQEHSDDKLKNLNKNVTSNKTKHVLVENELNELSKKVKGISTKELTKDLINGYKILNGAKYFPSGIFQNYLVFIPVEKYIKYFSGTTRINVMECQRKILKK